MLKLILLVLLVAVVVAVKLLPWWALLGGLVALVVFGKLYGARLLRRVLVQPFLMKSRVLRGAQALVHDVRDEEPPPVEVSVDAEADEPVAPEEPRRHVCIEVTITPTAQGGTFTHWEPGEMRLVPLEVRREDPLADDSGDPEADISELGAIEVFEDGAWRKDEGEKFVGPMRVRFHVALVPGFERLKFRYYFEDFGELVLPGAPSIRARA